MFPKRAYKLISDLLFIFAGVWPAKLNEFIEAERFLQQGNFGEYRAGREIDDLQSTFCNHLLNYESTPTWKLWRNFETGPAVSTSSLSYLSGNRSS